MKPCLCLFVGITYVASRFSAATLKAVSLFGEISFIREFSQIGTWLYTRLCGINFGADALGNRYYKSKRKNKSGFERRWVIYAGDPEASLVPPEWFAWLHHQCDDLLPTEGKSSYVWLKPHVPNLTGTEVAYLPDGHVLHSLGQSSRESTSRRSSTQSWKPPASFFR